MLKALTPGFGYTRQADIVFDENTGLQLDVYMPRGPATRRWRCFSMAAVGSEEGARGDYRFVGEALARQGLVAVMPDCRLYPAVRYPSFLPDAAQAVARTRRHIAIYGGNPESLMLMGHSAGAYNTAMLILDPNFLQAAGVQRGAIRGMVWLAERVRDAGGAVEARIYDHLDHPWAVASLAAPLRWHSDLAGVIGGFMRGVTQSVAATPSTAVLVHPETAGADATISSAAGCLTVRLD